MNPIPEMTNPETWADIVQFTTEFPDTDYWNRWRSMICPLLEQAIERGYNRIFRAGSSMHHLIFSTIDHHGLKFEPRVTIRVTEDWMLGIYYSTVHIDFGPAIESLVVEAQEAFPPFTQYLRHLWEETNPEPTPVELRQR